jgi:hypothetical protein
MNELAQANLALATTLLRSDRLTEKEAKRIEGGLQKAFWSDSVDEQLKFNGLLIRTRRRLRHRSRNTLDILC